MSGSSGSGSGSGSSTPYLGALDARLSGVSTMLAVLAAGMLVIGLALPGSGSPAKPAYGALPPTVPVRLVLPALKVSAPVVPIGLTGSALDPPRNYRQVGWWDASAKPGSGRGQVVITGHTVHTGGGQLDRLRSTKPGQTVDVVTKKGTMRYRVDSVKVFSKAAVAQRAVRLFGQSGGYGRLVLVSCTDWNGSDYLANIVVFGTPLGVPPAPAKKTTQAT